MNRAYVDTNIFDYVVMRDTRYGAACRRVLQGIGSKFDAVCSFQVPAEILGSLSTIDHRLAQEALIGFFSYPIKLVEISQKLLSEAASISVETKISGYDAIHVAAMRQENVHTIITENYKDFHKVKDIEVIRPHEYDL